MMNQIQRIAHHTKDLEKVLASHGADSGHFVNAFFVLQAARMGMPNEDAFKWAEAESSRLHNIALEQL